jgi:hypothetical protein
MMIRSVFTAPDGRPLLILGASVIDHRSPMEERWGGYYATGVDGPVRHLGNAMVTDEDHPQSMVTAETLKLASLHNKVNTGNYLSPYSDAAALMVFDHQMHMSNLITRVGWEIRAAEYDAKHYRPTDLAALLREAAEEFVDYLLFVDEAPFPGPIQSPAGSREKGSSGFGGKFARADWCIKPIRISAIMIWEIANRK